MNLLNKIIGSSEELVTYGKKNAGKLLSIGSGILTIAACVTTGKATWDTKDDIEEHNANIYDLHEDLKATNDPEEQAAIKKEISKEYVRTTLKVAKNYAVPAICLTGSIACDIASSKHYEHKIAMSAGSLMLIRAAYDKARQRHLEKYGEEETAKIFDGAQEKEIEVIDEKGKKKTQKITVYDPYGVVLANPCAVLLGDGIESNFTGNLYDKTAVYNRAVAYVRHKLSLDGSCCLWDVYTDTQWGFGLKPPESKKVMDLWKHSGWVWDAKAASKYVEDYIEENSERLALMSKREREKDINANIALSQPVTFGWDAPTNKLFRSGDEPMFWVLPNCIQGYEDLLYPTKEVKEWEEYVTE